MPHFAKGGGRAESGVSMDGEGVGEGLKREQVIDAIVRMIGQGGDGVIASKHGALCAFRAVPVGDGLFAVRDEVTLERTDSTVTRNDLLSNLRRELAAMDDGFLCMAYTGLADKRLRMASGGGFEAY